MIQPLRVVLVAALLLPVAALAGNYSFMADSPVTRFNAADKALYRAAIDKALAAEPGQPPVEWKNDQTGSSGSVTARAADQADCRLLAVTTRHAGMRGEAEHKVCKVDGQWKIAK
jgi:surface antigen